jgi:iron complex transport system permease protein
MMYSKINPINISFFIIIPVITILISLSIGRFFVPIPDIINTIFSRVLPFLNTPESTYETIIMRVRLPRIISALLVGACLSISGASYQGIFRNPMVSPDILGAAAGSGFGAALAILLSLNVFFIQILSFSFGLLAVLITFSISSVISRKSDSTLTMILTGMVVSTMFSSFISLTKYVADPNSKLPAITFWLMGSLSSIGQKDIYMVLVPMALGFVPLILLRWKINILSFGDEEAKSLGLSAELLRMLIIVATTLLTAASISICGLIGWVGLIIPHITRFIVGPDHKVLIPASAVVGATFLLTVDDIARCATSVEIPLGILTSIIGGPFFLYLLLKGNRELS